LARPSVPLTAALALCLAGAIVAGCDEASISSASTLPAPTPATASAGPTSAGPSASASASAEAASPTPTLDPCAVVNLPHRNTGLEDRLPSVLATVNILLCKTSLTLSAYLTGADASFAGAYTSWVVGLGVAPEDVDVAAASDLTGEFNIVLLAVQVPGVKSDLAASFGVRAKAAGWAVEAKQVVGRSLLEIDNGRNIAYVYSKEDVAYFVITDRDDLLLAALMQLP
jgi:hypothetical protein